MNDYLDDEIMNKIQPFSGTIEEMNSSENILSTGMALQKTQTSYTTAIAVQKPRSITRITHNVLEESKLAGSSFYYGWTVKNKNGSASKIEGPSIDLAMCLARHYGNCVIDVEGSETNTHYNIKGVFIDLESGFTCPRLFRQRKSQGIGGKFDSDRQEDIVFQIGQSKAIRNAVIRAMPEWLVNQAIEVAKTAELNKIKPENLHIAREKVISFFEQYGIDQDRIENKLEKKADKWTGQDIVELRGSANALKEGRISPVELFPLIEVVDKETGEIIKDDAKEKPDPSQETINQFWNLKETGLKDWELKNRKALSLMDVKVKTAFAEKWKRIFGMDYAEWLEKKKNTTAAQEVAESIHKSAGGNGVYLDCPQTNGKKSIKVCESSCVFANKCQVWEEYKINNQGE